ncbi:hypothetical protein BWI96_11895 [Siphonobacter sp. SORGH_AS_0500]|uniref:hypothetical protein n=1 Tax=Siphonobacter sp. SORGH_AS_0500 TaxID=1864824 RepID=UPI000CADE88A|nr:hypothetical protein [Siphonobacter sp. SORGH_AS_0500]PKK36550.1 hypothetical protein BWI96_11895 [Siphonobacter sp. SORGH_AS_0500]
MAIVEFEGYHGTNEANVGNILTNHFNISEGPDEWLGDGTYFFVEGISDPVQRAIQWAVVTAWDKLGKRNRYSRYSVIKAIITVEEEYLLDLTTLEGRQVMNYLQEQYVKKLAQMSKELRGSKKATEGAIINDVRDEGIFRLDVVKADFPFKFAAERILGTAFRQPNVTICAVFEPNNNINADSMCVVESGEVANETF